MRAPINEHKEHKSIGLPPRLWAFVKEVGNGQYAAGVRYILDQVYEQQQRAKVHTPESTSHTGADRSGIES